MDFRQFTCKFHDCGRSFTRKEHLSRHERAHDPKNLFICKVCNRQFNRNDSLQRHLVLHGNVFKPTPSGKSKRACVTCHAGKTKCDGKDHCTACVKKGIACAYRTQNDEPITQGRSVSGMSQPQPQPIQDFSSQEMELQAASGIFPSQVPCAEASIITPNAVPLSNTENTAPSNDVMELSMPSQHPRLGGLIDWLGMEVRRDPLDIDANLPTPKAADPTSDRYLKNYFCFFHPRWPIIHQPSIEIGKTTIEYVERRSQLGILQSGIRMIGAWLDGDSEGRKHAMYMHENLMGEILPLLLRISSQDKFQQTLSANLCQAALLNVIFGVYHGATQVLSGVIMLRNILSTALREVGFFKQETAWADEKPGYFLPLRMVKLGERQRLASYLFKVDIYLNMLRGQPVMIMPEELHYTLPTAFSLYNADGLDVWEERQSIEPIYRSRKSLFHMISETARDSTTTAEDPLLIEDLQLCICAMYSKIWKYSEHVHSSKSFEVEAVLQKELLRHRLEALKSRLHGMINQTTDNVEFGQEDCLPLRHYYGYEDHSQPDWREIVMTRVKCLFFDTFMLYHLFSIFLCAEVKTLTLLAKDRRLNIIEKLSDAHQQARDLRKSSMKTWAATPAARLALYHSMEILIAYQNTKQDTRWAQGLEGNTLEPVAYIALSVAGLVVWAYCTLAVQGCDDCMPGSNTVLELTRWSRGCGADRPFQHEMEAWVEAGTKCRVQLQAIQLCQCNVDLVMGLFQACLPESWAAVELIAPGVFKSLP